jgi:hypothetical protein
MGKVFITQFNKYSKNDYEVASEFGDLEYISSIEYENVKNSPGNAEIREDIFKFLKIYDNENDYIIPVGDPLGVILITSAIFSLYPYCNILKWDRREKKYVPYKLPSIDSLGNLK